jgi:hypothetical protein
VLVFVFLIDKVFELLSPALVETHFLFAEFKLIMEVRNFKVRLFQEIFGCWNAEVWL